MKTEYRHGVEMTTKSVTILMVLLLVILNIVSVALIIAIFRGVPESVVDRLMRENRLKEDMARLHKEQQEKLVKEINSRGESLRVTLAEIAFLIAQKDELAPIENILIYSDLDGQSEEFKKLAQLYRSAAKEFSEKIRESDLFVKGLNHRMGQIEGQDVPGEFQQANLHLIKYQKYFTLKHRYFLQTLEKLRSLASPELQKKVNKYYAEKARKRYSEELKAPKMIDPMGAVVPQ